MTRLYAVSINNVEPRHSAITDLDYGHETVGANL